jgi:hypothetical protein
VTMATRSSSSRREGLSLLNSGWGMGVRGKNKGLIMQQTAKP